MDRLVRQQPFGAVAQLVRFAIVVLQPFLEHVVDRLAFPSGRMIRIDRVQRAQLQDRLRVECEWVCLEPVDRGDGDLVGPLLRLRCRRRPVDGLRRTGIVERARQPFQPGVARQAAADCIEPQQKTRCDSRRRQSRRARVISTAGAPSALAKS